MGWPRDTSSFPEPTWWNGDPGPIGDDPGERYEHDCAEDLDDRAPTKDWADDLAAYFVHEMQAGKPLVAEQLATQFRIERKAGERAGLEEALAAIREARLEPMETVEEGTNNGSQDA